LYFH